MPTDSNYNPPDFSAEQRYTPETPTAYNFVCPASISCVKPFTPEVLGSAYCMRVCAQAGKGVSIAVISAFTNNHVESDLREFAKAYSLPNPDIEVYHTAGNTDKKLAGWSTEASADTQWAFAAAPMAKIICIFTPDAKISTLFEGVQLAVQKGADIISMSWGSEEFAGQTEYTDMLKKWGKTYIASAGNSGGAVYFPSSSDAVISVGGTYLHRTESGKVISRSAWKNGGGGPSRFTAIPPWQKKLSGIERLSAGFRATPDIALDACTEPGYSVYNKDSGGFTALCGTSIAAPVFAGICARIIERNAALSSWDRICEYLYGLYKDPSYGGSSLSAFEDITVGSNGKYCCLPGFDFCTGLGLPVGCNLV